MTDRERDPPDEQLMAAYAGGDASAFDVLFQRHRARLFTFLLHQVGARSTAEDVFQDVFLRVVRSRRRYRQRGSFRSWLYTIARNALADGRRRAALRSPRSVRGDAMEPTIDENEPLRVNALPADHAACDPVALSHAGELRQLIVAALLELPVEQREVFLLRERAGLDFAGIAEVTGCALGTVKSRMRYALAGLRNRLSERLAAAPEVLHE